MAGHGKCGQLLLHMQREDAACKLQAAERRRQARNQLQVRRQQRAQDSGGVALSTSDTSGDMVRSSPDGLRSFYPTHIPKLELFSGYGTPFSPRRAASAHMTKSLALDPHDLSSRGDLLPSRAGIPPRVASIIWNRNFPSLLSDPSTQSIALSLRRGAPRILHVF